MLTVSELKSLLRAHRLRLSKRLGQHHLIDARCVERLVACCALTPRETVVEIGAGLGALTEPLAKRAGHVLAIEADERICALLAERMRPFPNVTAVCQDILTFPWERAKGAVVVGAIPYHITSPLLVSLCEHHGFIKEAWLLLQREVAERLRAAPGTKAYGRLSILCQYRWRVSQAMTVGRRAFFPQPTVDSSWIRLASQELPGVAIEDERMFFEVVRAAFAKRRKTLVNCLSSGALATRAQAERCLKDQGLSVSVRGEALSLEQFASVARALKRMKSLR